MSSLAESAATPNACLITGAEYTNSQTPLQLILFKIHRMNCDISKIQSIPRLVVFWMNRAYIFTLRSRQIALHLIVVQQTQTEKLVDTEVTVFSIVRMCVPVRYRTTPIGHAYPFFGQARTSNLY